MPVTTDPSLDPRVVLGAVLFRSGDIGITRREVLRWAERFDASLHARARRRAALGALEDGVPDSDVEAAAADFRYARDLESADDLRRWLANRGLSVDAWWEALRRTLLEHQLAGVPVTDASPDDGEDARLGDLVVSDLLTAPAEALARRLAVAREVAQWAPPAAGAASEAGFDERHDVFEAIWRGWRAALMTEPALQAAVDRQRASWLVLDLVESRWPTMDAAREAASCVQYDGVALQDVAHAAGVPVTESTRLLAEAADVLRDGLLSAGPGELVGPIELAPRWVLVQVRGKRAPSLDEPLVRHAAELVVETRAVMPLVARHITWAEPAP